MIVALFVAKDGPYFGLKDVIPWTEEMDARKYDGALSAVAHPPCERWGRYWGGGPSAKKKRKLGNDGGCFEIALGIVRSRGGVLEHPAYTHAWKAFGLAIPNRLGGWSPAGDGIGFVCHLEQGHYGHRARKATWLYANSPYLPQLKWGPSVGERLDEGFHSAKERKAARARGIKPRARLSKKECLHTPIAFRDILIKIAEAL